MNGSRVGPRLYSVPGGFGSRFFSTLQVLSILMNSLLLSDLAPVGDRCWLCKPPPPATSPRHFWEQQLGVQPGRRSNQPYFLVSPLHTNHLIVNSKRCECVFACSMCKLAHVSGAHCHMCASSTGGCAFVHFLVQYCIAGVPNVPATGWYLSATS